MKTFMIQNGKGIQFELNYHDKNTSLHVSLRTRKFGKKIHYQIVAEKVSLLRKIYKRDAPFRAVFEVKTLAVLFSPYPREMKTNTRNLNLPPFWCLFLWAKIKSPKAIYFSERNSKQKRGC